MVLKSGINIYITLCFSFYAVIHVKFIEIVINKKINSINIFVY